MLSQHERRDEHLARLGSMMNRTSGSTERQETVLSEGDQISRYTGTVTSRRRRYFVDCSSGIGGEWLLQVCTSDEKGREREEEAR